MKTEENPLDNKICNDCNTVGQWGTFVDELICVSTKCCEKRLNENTNGLNKLAFQCNLFCVVCR